MNKQEFINEIDNAGYAACEIARAAISAQMQYQRAINTHGMKHEETRAWALWQGYARSLNLILGFETESAYRDEASQALDHLIDIAIFANKMNDNNKFFGDLLNAFEAYNDLANLEDYTFSI